MYIGSNAIDDIKIGSSSVDAVYLGNTQVWSAIPAAVKAHIARVTADGGTVPEQAKMIAMVKKLMTANLWNNCVFFGLPLGGVKKDGNQFVSNVYDLKANADLLQATGTKQPRYQTNGTLLHDGVDWTGSPTLAIGNTIRNTRQKLTAIVWVKQPTTTYGQCYFGRWVSGVSPLVSAFALFRSRTTNRMEAYLSDGALKRLYTSSFTILDNQWIQLAITFDGTVTDGVLGKFGIYSNGVLDTAPTKTTNLAINSVVDTDTQVSLGTLGSSNNGSAEFTVVNNTYLALPQIYNYALTAEQILWNFNNIRPEGV